MGMPRKTLRKRRTCGRWRIIDGLRNCCPYDKGHPGDCKPYAAVEAAARREELFALFIDHESDDVDCDSCRAARRASIGQCDPAYAIALRCDWARGILRTLYAADGEPFPEPPDEQDPEEVR